MRSSQDNSLVGSFHSYRNRLSIGIDGGNSFRNSNRQFGYSTLANAGGNDAAYGNEKSNTGDNNMGLDFIPMADDMQFFEDQINSCVESLKNSVMEKKSEMESMISEKSVPDMEFNDELWTQIEDLEKQYRNCVEIAAFMLDKNKELTDEFRNMQAAAE